MYSIGDLSENNVPHKVISFYLVENVFDFIPDKDEVPMR